MMFLTSDEIAELTSRKQRAAQRSVLNALGIVHKVRPDGTLVVLRAHVEEQLGAAPKAKAARAPVEPNWAALDEMRGRSRKPK